MAFFLISYDTHKVRRYQSFYDAMDEHGGVKLLESVYGIELTNTAVEVRDWLKNDILDGDDSILVIPAARGKGFATQELSQEAVSWINKACKSK